MPLITAICLLAVFSVCAAAVGRWLCRDRLSILSSPIDRLLIEFGIGLGCLQFISFYLFSIGLGKPRIVLAAFAIVLVLSLLSLVRRRSEFRETAAILARPHGIEWIGIAAITCVLASCLTVAACPITDDDGLSYHLSSVVRYLRSGRFQFLPTLTYTNWPLGIEMLMALPASVSKYAPVGVVSYLLGIVILACVLRLTARWRKGGVWWSVAILLFIKPIWGQMGTAHVDLGTAAFGLLTVLAFVHWHSTRDRGILWAASMLAGLTATTKLSGIWCVFGLAMCASVYGSGTRQEKLRDAGGALLIGICCFTPWLLKSWVLTGNPVYPAAYGLLGGRDWTPDGMARMQHYFLLLFSWPNKPPTFGWLIAARGVLIAALALVTAACVRLIRTPEGSGATLLSGIFAIGVCLSSGWNQRFVLGALVLLAVGAGCLIANRWPKTTAFAMILVIYLSATQIMRANDKTPLLTFQTAIGSVSKEEYLRRKLDDYAVVEFANRTLRPTDRILVATWPERNAYYNPMAYRSNYWFQDSVHYDTPRRLRTDLVRLGVTHVVFAPLDSNGTWCAKSYVCDGRDQNEAAAMSAYVLAHGHLLHQANGVSLYRIEP
jgi:hypothetical protein